MATATAQQRAAATDRGAARDYWETKSVAYDCVHDRLWAMLREVDQIRPASLFDVGCATGEVARAVTARFPRIDYFGCDISQAAVAKLGRPNVVQCDLNFQVVPFADRQFDCIVASGICEYLRDQADFVRQLSARLAPGGSLIISYVNVNHLARRWRRFLGRRPRDNATWQPLLPLTEFESLLRQASLRVERRIATNGRLTSTSDVAARLSPLRALCGIIPSLTSLLAPQVIYHCHK